ncbi:MAG: hypothetical protein ABIZ56_04870, partial [Chthoniobacteraceae bacterium]
MGGDRRASTRQSHLVHYFLGRTAQAQEAFDRAGSEQHHLSEDHFARGAFSALRSRTGSAAKDDLATALKGFEAGAERTGIETGRSLIAYLRTMPELNFLLKRNPFKEFLPESGPTSLLKNSVRRRSTGFQPVGPGGILPADLGNYYLGRR